MRVARTRDPRTGPALLAAAGELFYARGVGAVAVDDIAELSGLTKPTLYRHFRSKEDLVVAYLDDRHEQQDLDLQACIKRAPREHGPRAVIDWLCDWISRPAFNGCGFVRAYAELHDDPRVREKARRRKRVLVATIEEACRAAGAHRPAELAGELALIVEGATTMAFVSGDSAAVTRAARRLAQRAFDAEGLDK